MRKRHFKKTTSSTRSEHDLRTFELSGPNPANQKEIIKFLNSSTVAFFKNEYTFKDNEFGMFFKSLLLNGFNDIENTFRGTFCSGLSLSNVDFLLFKIMFPRASAIFQITDEKSAMNLGSILSNIRNLCAHAIPNNNSIKVLKKCLWNNLNLIRPFNIKLKWVNKDELTIAGLVFLVMLFLRAESIKNLTKRSRICSLISCGQYRVDDGKAFNEKISCVNLEIPIRTEIKKDILGAIAGRESKQLNKINNKTYSFEVMDYSSITYSIKFKIDCGHVKVFKDSLTKDYYLNDYDLSIKDLDGFIELSNKFPPFTFIDLLHRLNIHLFDKTQYDLIQQNLNLYSKLNYPKFYVNKNITVLLLSETNPDFRIVNSAINYGVTSIFLRLEDKIYKEYNIGLETSDYSTTSKALEKLKIDSELGFKIRALRNFAFHSYVFEDYSLFGKKHIQYTYSFVIETIRELELFFKKEYPQIYKTFSSDIKNFIVQPLINAKYNQITEYTIDGFDGHPLYPNPDAQDVKNKFLFLERSMVSDRKLERLFVDEKPAPYILEYILSDREQHLLIKNTDCHREKFNKYLASQGDYIEKERIYDGFFIKIYLEEQTDKYLKMLLSALSKEE